MLDYPDYPCTDCMRGGWRVVVIYPDCKLQTGGGGGSKLIYSDSKLQTSVAIQRGGGGVGGCWLVCKCRIQTADYC